MYVMSNAKCDIVYRGKCKISHAWLGFNVVINMYLF